MPRSRATTVTASVLAALVIGTSGYAVLDAYDRVPGILTLAPPTSATGGPQGSGGVGTPGAGSSGAGGVAIPVAPLHAAAPLAALSTTAPQPSAARVASALAGVVKDRRLGTSVSVVVRDAVTGRQIYGYTPDTARAPASTAKLLTAAASLSVLGPQATATTRVVQGSAPNRIVLVAGGDSVLATGRGDPRAVRGRAGLGDLAAQVARSLRARSRPSVTLGLDDHYAAGPRYAPKWLKEDIDDGLTGPVAMLGLASRRATPGHPAPTDAAMAATRAFATALRGDGITVARTMKRTSAGSHSISLGSVTSAPVVDVLTTALESSDNPLTETVARRAAARAGAGTGFASVAAFVRRTVQGLGVDTSGVRMLDSCGLSRGSGIPARVLTDVLDLAADGGDAALQQVAARLPVAGLSGTLRSRFHVGATRVAAGLVRAKTGTLTGVSALAGTLVDRDGRMLSFAIMADKVPARTGTGGARAVIDRFVASLAGCGCR